VTDRTIADIESSEVAIHDPKRAEKQEARGFGFSAFFRWLFSRAPTEKLPTDPPEVLYRSFHLTARCRYNASIRLARLARFSFLTTTLLALGLILVPLLQLSGLQLAYPAGMLGVLQIFLAVATLVYSVINATAHYETRSGALNECGDGIKGLSRELRTATKMGALDAEDLDSFNERYGDITTMSENHTRCDYWLAQLQSPRLYQVSGIPRLWLYIKTYATHLMPYLVPSSLISFTAIVILDILGITHLLTPLFLRLTPP
jgi:hypothetical protein